MENSNLHNLLKRYLTGQVNEQEKAKIEAWLDLRKTEAATDLELSSEDEERLFQKLINKTSSVEDIKELTSIRKQNVIKWTLRVAASILVIVMVSYFGWQQGVKNVALTEVTSTTGTEKIILNDGSLVWLKGSTNLIYYNKDREGVRYSELKGEALFEIAKDPSRPFIIQCGDAKIKVLGTSFSVRYAADTLELKVLTGKVNFSLAANANGIDVSPNEKVLYTGNGQLVKIPMNTTDAIDAVAGTQYPMAFSDQTLDAVIERLQKKFDVIISLTSARIGSCHITVDLTDHSLEKSLDIITEILNIQYQMDGRNITVRGNGC